MVYTGYGEGSIIPALFNELKEAGIAIIYRDINPTPENTLLAEEMGQTLSSPPVLTRADATRNGAGYLFHRAADCRCREACSGDGGGRYRSPHRQSGACVRCGRRVCRFGLYQYRRKPRAAGGQRENCCRQRLDLLLFRTVPHYYRSLPGKLADKLAAMDKAGASNEALGKAMGGLRACAWACWKITPMKVISRSARDREYPQREKRGRGCRCVNG